MGNTSAKLSCKNVDTNMVKPSAPPIEKVNNGDPVDCEDPVCTDLKPEIKIQHKNSENKTNSDKKNTDNFKTSLLLKHLENPFYKDKLDNLNLIQGEEPAVIDRRHVALIIRHINVKSSYILRISSNIEFLLGAKDTIHENMSEYQRKFIIFGLQKREFNLDEKKILAELIEMSVHWHLKNELLKFI